MTRLVMHALAACVVVVAPAGLPVSVIIATALLVLAYAMWEEERMWTRETRPAPSTPMAQGGNQGPESRREGRAAA